MQNQTDSFENHNSTKKSNVTEFHTNDMENLQLVSTSKGNQRKWLYRGSKKEFWIKEQFYYQNKLWKDYLVEIIASKIASQMDLHGISVIVQKECKIIDDDSGEITCGVYSENFSKNNHFISFSRIIQNKGLEFPAYHKPIIEKWDFVLKVISDVTGYNYSDYLTVMTLLDYLVGNEDRHLNNFGIMSNLMPAPLFDFGLGLFEHDRKYETISFQECLKKMECKPFHKNNQKTIDFLKTRLDIGDFVPEILDLTGVKIPSAKAGSYLRNRCRNLHITLKGVE